MTWHFQPYLLILIIAIGMALIVALVAWRRRATPGAIPLALTMLAAATWAGLGVLEQGVDGYDYKLFFGELQYVGIASVPAFWLIFALSYCGYDRFLTRRNLILLWIIPLVTIGMSMTNGLHSWMWVVKINPSSPTGALDYSQRGWWWYVAFIYNYALILTGMGILGRTALIYRRDLQRQMMLLLAAVLIPLTANILHFLKLDPFGLDLTPFAFSVTGVIVAFGLFRFQLFDLAPVARELLIENLSDGVMVLDAQNRVVDLNPAAQQMIGSTAAIGQPAAAVFAARPDLVERFRHVEEAQTEIRIEREGAPIDIDLRITPLRNRRGQLTGRLITLHDITERKRAEGAEQRRWQELDAMRVTLNEVLGELDLPKLLHALVERAVTLLDSEQGELSLYDRVSDTLRTVVSFLQERDYTNMVLAMGEGAMGRAAQTRCSMIVGDYATWEGRAAQYQTAGEHITVLVAPLVSGPELLGAISVGADNTRRKYTDRDVRLIEMFAQQAAIAIHNARLFEETQLRVDRLALINEISMSINLSGALKDVLQAAADGLMRVLSIDQVGVALLDEARRHLIVQADHPAPGNASAAGIELPLDGNLSMQRILATKSPLTIFDVQNDPLMQNVRKVMAQQRVRSILLVPMIVRGEVIGTIGCDVLAAPRRFAPEEIELAQTVANLVAARIEQAQLFEREREARRQAQRQAADLSWLYGITRATGRSLAVEDVVSQALSSALSSLEFEGGVVALVEGDDPARPMTIVAERGLPIELCDCEKSGGSATCLTTFIRQRREVVMINEQASGEAPAYRSLQANINALGWQVGVGIPLLHSDQLLGVMCLYARQARTSSPFDWALFASIGHQVAGAIANAQLFQATLSERSRLKALIESSRDGIILSTVDGRVAVMNAPALEMLRLPGQPNDWLNRPMLDAIKTLRHYAPQAVRATLGEMRRLQTSAEPPAEDTFEVPPHVIRWQSLPVHVGVRPLGRLLMLRDMTEERTLARLRDDMTHTMVHDLRNPLTSITASLNMMASGFLGTLTSEQQEVVQIAQHSSERMMKLVNAILDVSRLESGRLPLMLIDFSLPDLAVESLQAQQALAQDRGVRLEAAVSPALPFVRADRGLIMRVLQNLIGNAIKFTPREGSVRLAARVVDEQTSQPAILVSISDTGPGIPLDIQSQLFQKFVTGGREEHGSGLGLTFCKLVVEAHGQRIWVDSTPGEGATFTFTLAAA